MIHKRSRVEFHPLGVVGAIVSWNYPFHNIFNPMLAAVFSGNGIVIKVYLMLDLTQSYSCTPTPHVSDRYNCGCINLNRRCFSCSNIMVAIKCYKSN